MESNPAAGLIGFWMMLQLVAMLALLVGGIYLMYCLGRAASGLDRMASAMEEWVALQNANVRNATGQSTPVPRTPLGDTPPVAPIPPTPPTAPYSPAAPPETRPEYSLPDEPNRQL